MRRLSQQQPKIDPFICNHKWNGPSYFITASGKIINITTYPEYISYTDSYRSELIIKRHINIDDQIIGGGVTCLICNSNFKPSIYEI